MTIGTRYNDRKIESPRGADITCKSWLTEAPMRMLMNNLDPEVAEKPEEPGGLRRHRPGGAGTGKVSTASSARSKTWRVMNPWWCNRASRSASSSRTRTRRGC